MVRDELAEPLVLTHLPGHEYFRLRGSDQPPALPDDGRSPLPAAYFPPAGGFRFGFFVVPPAVAQAGDLDLAAVLAEFEQKLPGMAAVLEPDDPGMHTTDTIDFDVVIAGEVCLELDDGVEVLLKAGDSVVQNGARHRWTNRSSSPCLIAVCLVGAHRKPLAPGP